MTDQDTAPAESTPNGLSGQMSFEDATKHVSGLLTPEGAPDETEAATQETTQQESPEDVEPEREPETAPERETQSSEAEEETAETEPEAEAELPDTLSGLAEALDMQPEDLASHIKVPIKIDGEQREVTLAEAQRGFMRESDFTQKTQALAAEREKITQFQQQMGEQAQQRLSDLDAAIAAVEGLVDDGVSEEQLAELLEYNPTEYVKVKERRELRLKAIGEAKGRLQGEREEAARLNTQRMVEYRTQQQQILLEKLPHLKDPNKLQAFERESKSYLNGKGFSDKDVSDFFNGPFDARMVDVIADAAKYRALQKGSKKLTKELKGKGLPKPLKPGAATPRTSGEGEKIAESLKNLRRASKRGTKAQQKKAGVEYVKTLLG